MCDDHELVDRARNGDRHAIEALFRKHQHDLYRFTLNLMWFDHAKAQDLAQDTFLLAFERLGSLRDASSFRSWLLGIAYNLYRNDSRKKATRRDSAAIATAIADEPRQTDELVAAHEEQEMLRRALDSLAPGQKEAVYLREILGCSYKDTATILGIALSAAKNRVHAGKKNVQAAIGASLAEITSRGKHDDR